MVHWIPDTTFADPRAMIADDVRFGRFAMIGPDVRIESRVRVGNHVWLGSATRVGEGASIGDHCVIGHRTVRRFGFGTPASILIGSETTLGKGVVIAGNRRAGSTRLGSGCRVSSVCRIGAGSKLAAGVVLGSGTEIGDRVRIETHVHCGSGCRIHDGAKIGRNVVIGALSEVTRDVPPHVLAEGRGPILRGVNVTGLQRIGVEPRGIAAMSEVFGSIVRKGEPIGDVVERLERQGNYTQVVREFVAYFSKSADAVTWNLREPGRVA